MFDKLKQKLTKRKAIVNQDGSPWHATRSGCNWFGPISDGSYDNLFPDVSRIAEQIATILPYAINAEGERLNPQPQGIKALYSPNREMSGPEFFETLATLALIHPIVYVLVQRTDGELGEITPENIGGFTFLEGVSARYYADGSTQYNIDGKVLSDRNIIALSLNVNPYNLLKGYSPATAARKWATLDDYIAEWQTGNLVNNGVPAGEFIITARDPEEFNAIVDEMERKHKGAGRNNNVSYVHRPTSAIDGKPLPAQIEWVPFAQTARDLTLDAVFDQANKKTAMAFGVPEEIKGFVQNSNYASVATAERIFDKYTILPKATKIWAKFTHELNRITGGLGYAITFDYEPAQLADEDKVNAETTRIQLETLRSALDAGFDLDSSVVALELPDSFKTLNMRPEEETETNQEAMDDFETEASQIATSTKIAKTKKKSTASTLEAQLLIDDYLQAQIEAEIYEEEFDEEKRSKQLAKDLLPILMAGAVIYAMSRSRAIEAQAAEAGYDVSKVPNYTPSEEFRNSYLEYLEKVALSFTGDTSASIKRVLEMAFSEEFTKDQTKQALSDLILDEEWRAKRLMRTELHRSEQMAVKDYIYQTYTKGLGIEGITKVWHINPATDNHCGLCEALDGVEIPIDDSFQDFADAYELGSFSAGEPEVADAHPNCQCYLTFNIPNNESIETSSEPVEFKSVKCPKCKRYICDCETKAKLTNVVCSRCGTHFDKEPE